MDPCSRAYVEIDLISLHYVTFINPPTESLFLGSEWFMNNSINKLIEEKVNDPFLLKEYLFITILFS
jgi:hypothetical protein